SLFTLHMTDDESDGTKLLAHTKNGTFSGAEGLNVYRQAYFLRVREALADAFPTLHYVLEEAGFNRLCASYLRSTPLTHFSLDRAGMHLPGFLRDWGLYFDAGAAPEAFADIAAFDLAL